MKKDILIEICCGGLEDAVEAKKGGADRIELNSALFLGGLTPSIGALIETKKAINIPVMVMIRPRPGGFCYSEYDILAMEKDIQLALEYGADGVAFGVLNQDGTVNQNACKRLLKHTGNAEVVFHRAFDVTPNPIEALDTLIDLGFKRVLTSGQKTNALEGAALLKELVAHGEGHIEILPGGGIRQNNAMDICKYTGCNQIHMGPLMLKKDTSTANRPDIHFYGKSIPSEDSYQIVDSNVIKDVRRML